MPGEKKVAGNAVRPRGGDTVAREIRSTAARILPGITVPRHGEV